MDNQRLCDLCFGGCSRRWSAAIKWYVKFLEVRYRDILNVVGLDREKENIPRFARAIARKLNMEKEFIDPETGERHFCDHLALFDEYMFNIFCFIDGSYFKTNTPGSGPHGDYEGSMRRPNWYIMQRSVYNRYKRLHGIHILSLMLPNGINYIYGPNSVRGGDVLAMMHLEMNLF